MAIGIEGLGSYLEGGTGGGITVIPNGGTIAGTYVGSVYCEGDVSLADDVYIYGELYIGGDPFGFFAGELTNPSGYSLFVEGSLRSFGDVTFEQAEPTIAPTGFLIVLGDFIAQNLYFTQHVGVSSLMQVGGDLTILSDIIANGETGTPGLTLYVAGNLNAYYIEMDGGNSSVGNGGNGGQLYVKGNLTTAYLYQYGGDATNSGGSGNGGQGGYLEVGGNAVIGSNNDGYYGTWDFTGGSSHRDGSNQGSAGNGGTAYISGNLTVYEFYADGGYCDSYSENDRSGTGGTLDVFGDMTVIDFGEMQGGQRDGTIIVHNTLNSPDGGDLYVKGNLTISPYSNGYIDLSGGTVNTQPEAPHNAGYGGYAEVGGKLTANYWYARGGNMPDGNGEGGGGGELDVWGGINLYDNIVMYGGYSNHSNSGGGGQVYCYGGDLFCNQIQLYGNDHDNTDNGHGGSGGYIYVAGDLIASNFIQIYGGDCSSNGSSYRAGQGGSIEVQGDFVCGDSIAIYGGYRTGGTSGTAPTNTRPNAGYIIVNGDMMVAYGIQGGGGSVDTQYKTAKGGNGVQITVAGNLTMRDTQGGISAEGGNSAGHDAGNGGYLNVGGTAALSMFYGEGGAATVSSGDSLQGQAGAGGSGEFRNGISCGRWDVLDSTVGADPASNLVSLTLAGACTFDEINMTNRSVYTLIQPLQNSVFPFGVYYRPVLLKVSNLTDKGTLNNPDGSETSDVSGNASISLYASNHTGWVGIQGMGV